MPSRSGPVDDDDIELPPLDSDETDETDEASDTSEEEALLDAPPDDDGDALDDSVASDLEIGSQLDDDPSDDGGDDDESGRAYDASLDEALDPLEETLGEGDEEGIAVEDEDLDRHDALEGDDGGAEGTGEPIENEIDDGALPELDADEGGDFEVGDLLPEQGEAEPIDMLPAWAAARWTVLPGAGSSVPSRAVAIAKGRVLASGDVMLCVPPSERAARRMAELPAAYAVAMTDATVLLATARGLVAQVGEGPLNALLPPPGGRAAIKLAGTAERAWALRDEALWRVSAPSSSAAVPLRDKGCLSIANSGGTLVALVTDEDGPLVERSHAEDRWESTRLDPRVGEAAASEAPYLAAAAAGRVLALAARGGEVALSRDAGATFELLGLGAVLALCFEGDEDDAPLLSLHGRDGEESAYLVRSPPGAPSELVAEIPGAADEVGAFAATQMTWDSGRDVLWVACHAGLLALGATRTH